MIRKSEYLTFRDQIRHGHMLVHRLTHLLQQNKINQEDLVDLPALLLINSWDGPDLISKKTADFFQSTREELQTKGSRFFTDHFEFQHHRMEEKRLVQNLDHLESGGSWFNWDLVRISPQHPYLRKPKFLKKIKGTPRGLIIGFEKIMGLKTMQLDQLIGYQDDIEKYFDGFHLLTPVEKRVIHEWLYCGHKG